MIFTVVWLPSARDELAELWLHAADRQAVSRAANTMDRLLREDPQTRGQPLFGHRVLAVEPLTIAFDVSADDRMVTVTQIYRIGP